MTITEFRFTLPAWVNDINEAGVVLSDLQQRTAFVVEASRRNITEHGGGPFAAGIFAVATGKLIALGVNLVVIEKCSILHAEMVAIMIAQRALGTYSFTGLDLELITSCEPCAMCYGAVPWSGVRRLVCAAREEDARAAGFDEGAKVANWQGELRTRGIDVDVDVCRIQAAAVLSAYASNGGEIYNGRGPTAD